MRHGLSLFALMGASIVLAAPACGPAAPDTPPTETVQQLRRAIDTGTYWALYDLHWTLENKKRFDRSVRRTLAESAEYAALADAPSRELFQELFPMFLESDDTFRFEDIVGEEVHGGTATVTVRHPDASTRTLTLLAEDGQWKFAWASDCEVFRQPGPDAPPVDDYALRE